VTSHVSGFYCSAKISGGFYRSFLLTMNCSGREMVNFALNGEDGDDSVAGVLIEIKFQRQVCRCQISSKPDAIWSSAKYVDGMPAIHNLSLIRLHVQFLLITRNKENNCPCRFSFLFNVVASEFKVHCSSYTAVWGGFSVTVDLYDIVL
jgi:hypothetical protein